MPAVAGVPAVSARRSLHCATGGSGAEGGNGAFSAVCVCVRVSVCPGVHLCVGTCCAVGMYQRRLMENKSSPRVLCGWKSAVTARPHFFLSLSLSSIKAPDIAIAASVQAAGSGSVRRAA